MWKHCLVFLYSGMETVDSGTLAGCAAGMVDAKVISHQVLCGCKEQR